MDDKTELYKQVITTDNVANYGTAFMAHVNAKRGKRSYTQVQEFEENLRDNLHELIDEIQAGTYRTGDYIVETINDGKKPRIIAKVPYKDRVVQWMLAIWYQPYYLELLSDNTHAAIPGRGIHSALRQAEDYIRKDGNTWVLKLDIRKYFPHIHRATLLEMIREDIEDDNLFEVIKNIILDAPDSIVDDEGTAAQDGIPISNYWSQFMANRYMVEFTRWMETNGYTFCQYMDDIVVFSKDKEQLRRAKFEIEWYMERNLSLSLKANWQIFRPADRGLDFVGYRIFPDKTIIRKDIYLKMTRSLRAIAKKISAEKTKELTESQRCTVMSYLGWVCHCTSETRRFIYFKYFAPILSQTHTPLSHKLTEYFK
ncbi:MAG TPA: reverse transcriptase domain-containing protein [Methanocorpusculum sp.]|nr:reverse transcriptase domain-containing protein [Methanocorpusculum sp.]